MHDGREQKRARFKEVVDRRGPARAKNRDGSRLRGKCLKE